MSAAEAEHVMKVGLPLMHRSLAGGRTESIRTSTTAMLPARDPVVRAITERAAHLSGYPYGNIEPLQLVQYTPGQRCATRRTLATAEVAARTTARTTAEDAASTQPHAAHAAPRSRGRGPARARYEPHFDYGEACDFEENLRNGHRHVTMLVYLNDVPEEFGGHTVSIHKIARGVQYAHGPPWSPSLAPLQPLTTHPAQGHSGR